MSAETTIEWTDRTWNPVRGCSVISPGCVNCYAMKQAHRFSGEGKAYEGLTKQTKAGPQWTGKIKTVESALLEPLSWRKPQRVFVNSMSDLFHEDVPDAFIDKVFGVMGDAKQHTFQILTKRPARMKAYFDQLQTEFNEKFGGGFFSVSPYSNVWLGVSVENQHFADERIPLLLQTPAAHRFISAEPLLGPVDLKRFFGEERRRIGNGIHWHGAGMLHWVIVGGESGPGARHFNIEWARAILGQCKAASVPCFVKQLGAKPYRQLQMNGGTFTDPMCRKGEGKLVDRKGGDMDEWPEDLQVREFPEARC